MSAARRLLDGGDKSVKGANRLRANGTTYIGIDQVSGTGLLVNYFKVTCSDDDCGDFSWDFAGAVSIFGPDTLPVVHQ